MSTSAKDQSLPAGYLPLPGSERKPSPTAQLLGPADAAESFRVTIVLRRRTDGPALPDFDHFERTPRSERPRLAPEEFAGKYGAHPDDIDQVVKFAEKSGLKVEETHAVRRTVVVSGTVAQMNRAFHVSLGRYQRKTVQRRRKLSHEHTENYRGREGSIHVPAELAKIILGVFGLDNRNITHSNAGGDPANTTPLTVAQVAQLYNFPTNSAAGQTIGIISPSNGYGGYYTGDLQQYFGAALPTVTPIAIGTTVNGSIAIMTTAQTPASGNVLTFASTAGIKVDSWIYVGATAGFSVLDPNNLFVTAVTATTVTVNQALLAALPVGTKVFFNPDWETTQDICIAAGAAPGANVAVYLSNGDQAGWVNLLHRAVHPNPGDPVCSVLSSSYYISNGDDTATMANWGVTSAMINAISAAFQDAAIQGVTVCIASGDTGANSKAGKYPLGTTPETYAGDGKAHVQYPASDPWVLAVGGTTIGNVVNSPPSFDEYVWNDPTPGDASQWGTTGGGVSDFFALPSYQNHAGVPKSANDGKQVGRGVPDVAGNASYHSGYSGLFVAGLPDIGNGTSASAPHWAGLIAVLNAALGEHVGFINPSIYKFGTAAFRDMNPPPGPADNSNWGIAGYPAGPGWDACTGWGSPNGVALLTALQALPAVYITGGYQSPDVILSSLSTHQPIPIGGMPGGAWDTLLQPNTDFGFAAVVHNDSASAVNGVQVKFWAIPGGVGTNGTMIGTPQTVNLPAYSSVTVNASAPFTSAPLGGHRCAVVSIYSPATGCAVDAQTALQIPDPGEPGTHGCSAWRNTDSSAAGANSRFGFRLGLGKNSRRLTDAILVKIQSVHVPAKWTELAPVRAVADALQFVGAEARIPLYLLPAFARIFPPVAAEVAVTGAAGGEIKAAERGLWKLLPDVKAEETSFEVAGQIPATAKSGDILLVRVTVLYPRTKTNAARAVEFLQVIHVTNRLKK